MKNQAELETQTAILFNDKEMAMPINLETLTNSAIKYVVGGTLPPSRPINHYDFIQWIQQELEDVVQDDVIIEPIYISKRHTNQIQVGRDNQTFRKHEPCPIELLNIDRLVTRVHSKTVTNLRGQEFNPSFAISYNDRGIEIAYGTNVMACSNMNIFGDSKWSTYGSNKVNFETIKTLIRAQMSIYKESFAEDLRTIEFLMDKECNIDDSRKAVAKLFEIAVETNVLRRKDNILNISQCVKLQEELIKKFNTAENNNISWWDFTQAGTEHLKPNTQDMVTLYPTISSFNNWVVNNS